jgi:hypothetical protein
MVTGFEFAALPACPGWEDISILQSNNLSSYNGMKKSLTLNTVYNSGYENLEEIPRNHINQRGKEEVGWKHFEV